MSVLCTAWCPTWSWTKVQARPRNSYWESDQWIKTLQEGCMLWNSCCRGFRMWWRTKELTPNIHFQTGKTRLLPHILSWNIRRKQVLFKTYTQKTSKDSESKTGHHVTCGWGHVQLCITRGGVRHMSVRHVKGEYPHFSANNSTVHRLSSQQGPAAHVPAVWDEEEKPSGCSRTEPNRTITHIPAWV